MLPSYPGFLFLVSDLGRRHIERGAGLVKQFEQAHGLKLGKLPARNQPFTAANEGRDGRALGVYGHEAHFKTPSFRRLDIHSEHVADLFFFRSAPISAVVELTI